MSTKMKGLLKGLRYISQIFDEDKEPEMQIGFPTDVKHVAHIGWDGPSVDSPSWLKEFKAPGGFQSAPLTAASGEPQESPQVKWVSEDSKSKGAARGNPDAPRSSRRRSAENSESSSTGKEVSSTRKGSRRQSKESSSSSSDSVKSSQRQIQERCLGDGGGSESNSGSFPVPDIPKKSRRKKSKEAFNGGSTRPSRSKPNNTSSAYNSSQFPDEAANGGSTRGSKSKAPNSSNTYTSHFPDPEPESGSVGPSGKDEFSQLSVMKLPNIAEEDNGSSGVS